MFARVFPCVFTGSLVCAEIMTEFAATESMLRLLVMLLMTERAMFTGWHMLYAVVSVSAGTV